MSLVRSHDSGTVTVPESTLVEIAVTAAEGVEGIRVLRRRSIDLPSQRVRLAVAARRDGLALAEAAQGAQSAVAGALEAMCGLELQVEITVAELT